MVFEKNLNSLSNLCGRIIDDILEVQDKVNKDCYNVQVAKNGDTTISIRKNEYDFFLASKYSPSHEAECFFEVGEKIYEHSIIIMYGFGTGSFVRYLQEIENVQIIVYEPDVELFCYVLKNIDISDIFDKQNCYIATGKEKNQLFEFYIKNMISSQNIKTTQVRDIPVYKKIYSEEYIEYSECIKKSMKYVKMNISTLIKMSGSMIKTGIMNIPFLRGCRSATQYYNNVFPKDLPIIIVSAGPSLKKNIKLLNEVKNKAVILVVDTALRAVMAEGIIPDIIYTLDPEKPVELFQVEEDIKDIFFFSETVSNTEVLDEVQPKNLVFYSSNSPLWAKLFEEAGSEIRNGRVGGSVATSAIGNAMALGFTKIILIGQDLAFTGNKQYFDTEDLTDEEEEMAKQGKVVQNGEYKNAIVIKDIYGNDVYTTGDYYAYIKEIEQLAFVFSGVEIIDATEGGAYKKYTTIMTLREAIDKYCVEKCDVKKVLNSVPRLFEGDKEDLPYQMLKRMKDNFAELKEVFKDTSSKCQNAADTLKSNKPEIEILRAANDGINEADTMLNESLERTMIMECAPWADYNFYSDFYIEQENHVEESIRIYEKSVAYYSDYSKACKQLLEIVEECLKKMERDAKE